MVRDKRWKLIEYVVGDQHHTQLFDLSKDPDELNNLAAKESSADVLTRLRDQLLHLAKNFGDPDAAIFRDAIAGKKEARVAITLQSRQLLLSGLLQSAPGNVFPYRRNRGAHAPQRLTPADWRRRLRLPRELRSVDCGRFGNGSRREASELRKTSRFV